MAKRNKKRRKPSPVLVFGVFILIVVVGFWIDINAGYTTLHLRDFIAIMTGTASDAVRFTFVGLRLPRIVTAMFVGAGLAVSGCVLQGVSRNELADPAIIGVNAGASLAVAVGLTFFSSATKSAAFVMPLLAFLGACASTLVVYLLSFSKQGEISPNRFILNGVAISMALNSLTVVLLLKMNHSDYEFIEGWISGNIWGASWDNIRIMVPCIVLLLCFVMYKANTLNVLGLGNQTATGLGVSIRKESFALLLCSVALASLCVAVGGGIGFVGLICPHLARLLIGSRHQLLLPLSALCGMGLLLVSDIIARTIVSPQEVSIGIVVAVIGAPYFLYLLTRSRK